MYRFSFAIGLIHILAGTAIIVVPDVVKVTAFSSFLFPVSMAGGILIIVGYCAIMASLGGDNEYVLLLLIPQQFILFLQLGGIINSISLGRYPDGYVPDPDLLRAGLFIFVDQLAWITLTAFHTVETFIAIWKGRPV